MEKLAPLEFNDPAPDLDIQTAEGKTIRLSSLWAEKTLVLVFTRHFGCPQCKEMLSLIVAAKSEIEQAGLTIAAVAQGTPSETLEFCNRQAPGVVCLSDPERKAYRAYGLERGSLWQVILSPQVLLGTLRAWRRGHGTGLPPKGQDVMQLSGVFIIGTDGKIRLPYYYDTIADHPPADLLLRGVLATSWAKPLDSALG